MTLTYSASVGTSRQSLGRKEPLSRKEQTNGRSENANLVKYLFSTRCDIDRSGVSWCSFLRPYILSVKSFLDRANSAPDEGLWP